MVYFVIPARKNSKGLPFKNRTLFDLTAGSIPEEMRPKTIVSTDDEELLKKASYNYGFIAKRRPKELSLDSATPKSAMKHATESANLSKEDLVVSLYLTYPKRNFEDVEKALSFMKKNKASSLLCRKDLKTHPYLCLHSKEDGIRGAQIIEHDLHRRQDYPECFEICHYICAFKVFELENLNNNLYNADTIFYPIGDNLNIDTPEDLAELHEN